MNKGKKRSIVLLFGTFDILHKGHEFLFKKARRYGNFLVAILARDTTIIKIKKQRAVFKEKDRLNNLRKTGWADLVFLGDKYDHYKLIKKIKPQTIILGYDQTNFTDKLEGYLKQNQLSTKIVRLKSHKPYLYKSSILRKKLYA